MLSPSPSRSHGLALTDVRVMVMMAVFKPISNKTGAQSERLDSFYQGQSELYDATRGGLLKGRTTVR